MFKVVVLLLLFVCLFLRVFVVVVVVVVVVRLFFSSAAQIDLACFRQLHSIFENHTVHETLLCLQCYLRKRRSFLCANAGEQVVIHNIKK